jgi:outer membrane protein OmpA-like peptidoglycan-associated protein
MTLMTPLDFASDQDLLDRLSARPHELVYLVGSAVTAPSRVGEPGVPRINGIIEFIRAEYYHHPSQLHRLDAELAAEPENRYQAAFRFLLRTRDQDVANAVIRRAVLLARRPSVLFPVVPPTADDSALCRALEEDIDGWHLPPAVEALGQIVEHTHAARPVVLTSNFDPLVAVSVRRNGGRAYTTALHGDGSLAGVDGHGCLIVHFHGDWFRTDTLHTPMQLRQDRPKLAASISQLVNSRTLVVMGYSGWDDVFTRSLIAAVRGGLAPLKIAWTFHADDEEQIRYRSGRLIDALLPGIELGRVVLYKGINVHSLLPRLAERLVESSTRDLGSQKSSFSSRSADGPSTTHLGGEVRESSIAPERSSQRPTKIATLAALIVVVTLAVMSLARMMGSEDAGSAVIPPSSSPLAASSPRPTVPKVKQDRPVSLDGFIPSPYGARVQCAPTTFYYKSGHVSLSGTELERLKVLAQCLKRSDGQVILEVHADPYEESCQTVRANCILFTDMRGASFRNTLIEQGVHESRVIIVSHGDLKATSSDRPENRRVDVTP